jgi:hypothetical protein
MSASHRIQSIDANGVDTEVGLAGKDSNLIIEKLGDGTKGHKADDYTRTQRLGSAMFFSLSSLTVIFMNKAILTKFDFPHFNFLATIQFFATFAALSILAFFNKIEIHRISFQLVKEVLPITLLFLGNIITGLGGTRNLSLPMFTVLRRFSILMTMLAEWYIIGSQPTQQMIVAVSMMIGGSSIAAFFDFSYDPEGYTLVMMNNVFTALNGVYMKKALSSEVLKKSNMSILYYNSAFSAFIMFAYFGIEQIFVSQQNAVDAVAIDLDADGHSKGLQESSSLDVIYNHPQWSNPSFQAMFIIGALLGSVLNYSIFLCTQYNSALTTAVIGCLKNVATSYIGMVMFTDFVFNWPNFIGINISIAGSLYFTYFTMFLKNNK